MMHEEIEDTVAYPGAVLGTPLSRSGTFRLNHEQLPPIIPDRETDLIHQPKHYTVGGIETIDYMKAKSSPEEFKGHLRLTALKYISRSEYKDNALSDYKKAAVYINWLINYIEKGDIR